MLAVLTVPLLQTLQAQEEALIYIGDPMCSWCYGFSPELEAIHQAEPALPIQVVVGGLRPNGTENMAKLGDFLQHHWEEVNAASGQKFSYGILKNESFLYNTEPACRAVVTVREMSPGKERDFFHYLQEAFYFKNLDLTNTEVLCSVVKDYGLDSKAFKEQFESQQMKELTQIDFALASEMGISGFPSMVLKKGEDYHLITKGYQKSDVLIKLIRETLSK